jgi:hypothetical protein
VDGDHIPTKARDKRSFEALSAIVYRPSCLERVDLHHQRITDKSCVVSALDDELKTIKTYLHHASLKQGLTVQTKVMALADGAHNCWSVIFALKPHCQILECILDWFHIAQKFQHVKTALAGACDTAIDTAQWSLWQPNAPEALRKIAFIRDNITDEKHCSQLQRLHDYLKNNLDYLVDSDQRQKAKLVFTTQGIESQSDTLINARHKRKQKMQWPPEGAHNVLQI